MPPSVDDRLIDIRDTILEIAATLAGKTHDDFLAERPLRLLTERLLEIVCEASRRLPDDMKASEPSIDWLGIVNFANLLRHAYHSTEADVVWDIVQEDLPMLLAFAEKSLKNRRT